MTSEAHCDDDRPSPRFGFPRQVGEADLIKLASSGHKVEVDLLKEPYQNGQLWCGLWRFYVHTDDGIRVLSNKRSNKDRDFKTINGVVSMIRKLELRNIEIPLFLDTPEVPAGAKREAEQ